MVHDRDDDLAERTPLQLTRWQEDVVRALASAEDRTRPLSQWYLGALHALSNLNNPDRIAQAPIHYENLWKNCYAFYRECINDRFYNIQENRRSLANRFEGDRARYSAGWQGKVIDAGLSQTIQEAAIYFENSQHPSRKEQVQSMLVATDPLVSHLDTRVLQSKRDAVHKMWERLTGIAHHGSIDEQGFDECLVALERMILDQLAPITAQDQQEIRSILEQTEQSE